MSIPEHSPNGGNNLRRARPLSRRECRTWLGSHHEGRLRYCTGRGPRAVVVSYAMTDDQILFRLPDYTEIIQYALGEEITLEVVGERPDRGSSEEVTVTGEAHPPEGPAIIGSTHFEETWPSGVSTRVMCLDLTRLRGTELATELVPRGERVTAE